MGKGESAEKVVRDIQRRTRRRFSAEEKIRIVLEGLRGEESAPEVKGLRDENDRLKQAVGNMNGLFAQVAG